MVYFIFILTFQLPIRKDEVSGSQNEKQSAFYVTYVLRFIIITRYCAVSKYSLKKKPEVREGGSVGQGRQRAAQGERSNKLPAE